MSDARDEGASQQISEDVKVGEEIENPLKWVALVSHSCDLLRPSHFIVTVRA
jgi:hypothetical protein